MKKKPLKISEEKPLKISEEETLQILQEATCPSVSGRTELNYQIGRQGDDGISLRVTRNSSSGVFNRQWVSYDQIEGLLATEKDPFSWNALAPLYAGRSNNSPGFLLAVLVAEKLVEKVELKYRWNPEADFLAHLTKKKEKAQ